jgi:hypothetical protein
MTARRLHPLDRAMLDRMDHKLNAILRRESFQSQEIIQMAVDLTEIRQRVTETRDAEAAAVILLTDLKSRLDAAGADPVALKELSDSLGSGKEALAAAIVANTSADPAAPPPEPVA